MFLLLLYMKKLEHPLFIKREALTLHNTLEPLLKDGYLRASSTIIDLIEEVAYQHYVKDVEIRTYD